GRPGAPLPRLAGRADTVGAVGARPGRHVGDARSPGRARTPRRGRGRRNLGRPTALAGGRRSPALPAAGRSPATPAPGRAAVRAGAARVPLVPPGESRELPLGRLRALHAGPRPAPPSAVDRPLASRASAVPAIPAARRAAAGPGGGSPDRTS